MPLHVRQRAEEVLGAEGQAGEESGARETRAGQWAQQQRNAMSVAGEKFDGREGSLRQESGLVCTASSAESPGCTLAFLPGSL